METSWVHIQVLQTEICVDGSASSAEAGDRVE
jgi:hypothetical protein